MKQPEKIPTSIIQIPIYIMKIIADKGKFKNGFCITFGLMALKAVPIVRLLGAESNITPFIYKIQK